MVHGPSAWMLLLFVIAVYRLRFYILHLQLDVSVSYCLCNSVLVTIVVWFVYFCIHMQFVYKLTRFMYSILLLCCNCIQQNEPFNEWEYWRVRNRVKSTSSIRICLDNNGKPFFFPLSSSGRSYISRTASSTHSQHPCRIILLCVFINVCFCASMCVSLFYSKYSVIRVCFVYLQTERRSNKLRVKGNSVLDKLPSNSILYSMLSSTHGTNINTLAVSTHTH